MKVNLIVKRSEFVILPPMNIKNEIRVALGFTQREMAEFLGITRSYYAMFETGKRPLPTFAMQRLTSVASSLASKNQKDRAKLIKECEHTVLVRLLKDNEFRQMSTKKYIEKIERKNISIGRRLAEKEPVEKLNSNDSTTAEILDRKNFLYWEQDSVTSQLIRLEIKEKVLEFECALLKRRLGLETI